MKDSLGDRMKGYECVYSTQALRRTPLAIRVDGRAFHTFTRRMTKPFDSYLMDAMVNAAFNTALEMQGFKIGYVQSDEATFILSDYDTIDTRPWFGYDIFKIVSISAALMTQHFHRMYTFGVPEGVIRTAVFDARAFSVPEDEVANLLLWRARDWERNSLAMCCQAVFSHKQLQGKNQTEQHEMLHSVGKNWATDLSDREKNGTFIVPTVDEKGRKTFKCRSDVQPHYSEIESLTRGLFTPGIEEEDK